MNDTVQTTGNEGVNAAGAAETTQEVAQATENVTPQSEGANDTSAKPDDKDTSVNDDGKVAEADKDKANEKKTEEEGGQKTQKSEFDVTKLKLPDGFTATDEQRSEFKKDAESLGITTQEGAQKFLDWVLEKAKAADSSLAKQQEDDMGKLEAKWAEEGKKDPVLGKDYEKNVSDAMDTASKIFSPHTIEFLKDTRLDKNPDFLKDMLRLAKERADADLIVGQSTASNHQVRRDSQGNPMLTFK